MEGGAEGVGRGEDENALKRLGPGDFSTPAPSLAAGGEVLTENEVVDSFLKVHARQSRGEKFGTKTPNELVDLCIFSTMKCLPHSWIPKPSGQRRTKPRLLFDMDALVAAQRLAEIDQFEGRSNSSGRQPGDRLARRGEGLAGARPHDARRPPPLQRARRRRLRRPQP